MMKEKNVDQMKLGLNFDFWLKHKLQVEKVSFFYVSNSRSFKICGPKKNKLATQFILFFKKETKKVS